MFSYVPFNLFIDQVIDNSNILEDLYTDEELNVENIKDRTDKIKFLQKLIDLISEFHKIFPR